MKNLRNPFFKKSLRENYVKRQKELIDQENVRISKKMRSIKSDLNREDILKIQNVQFRDMDFSLKPACRQFLIASFGLL